MGKRDNKSTSFNNPFESLKGLSVSGEKPARVPTKPQPQAPDAPKLAPEPEPTFDEAMQQLGVRRIAAGDEPLRPVRKKPSPEASASGSANAGASRQGKLLKEVQRGRFHPEAELDLHGMTVAQALPKVGWFLENAAFHGCRVVRIITGRGKSSPGEQPVLRPQVEAYLSGPGCAKVRAWGPAPPQLGGEGALLICLDLSEIEEGG